MGGILYSAAHLKRLAASTPPGKIALRPAALQDLPFLSRVHAHAAQRYLVSFPFSESTWKWYAFDYFERNRELVRIITQPDGTPLGVVSFGIAFRHQYLERGEAGKKMLEQIPNVFKRERRRDVIERGTGSQHFVIAVARMVLLLDEMEEALARHAWLAGDRYTLADVAFTPYLARLEHLNILSMVGERHRVADWYRRCQARPSFRDAIVKWENADYLALMKRRGTEAWPQVQEIMRTL
jgi:hypothetical protein